jgi:hypothetical protein
VMPVLIDSVDAISSAMTTSRELGALGSERRGEADEWERTEAMTVVGGWDR